MGNVPKKIADRRSGLFIIPDDECGYQAPDDYPDDAKRYLRYLARTRQVNTSIAQARIDAGKPGRWRRDPEEGGLDGFVDEEERAKQCFLDWQEGSFFTLIENEKGMPAVTGKIFLLKSLLPEYAERKAVEHKGAVAVGWLDMFGGEE